MHSLAPPNIDKCITYLSSTHSGPAEKDGSQISAWRDALHSALPWGEASARWSRRPASPLHRGSCVHTHRFIKVVLQPWPPCDQTRFHIPDLPPRTRFPRPHRRRRGRVPRLFIDLGSSLISISSRGKGIREIGRSDLPAIVSIPPSTSRESGARTFKEGRLRRC